MTPEELEEYRRVTRERVAEYRAKKKALKASQKQTEEKSNE